MAAPDVITVSQLSRLIGTPDAPVILMSASRSDHALDPRALPGSRRADHKSVAAWAGNYAGRTVSVVCQRGQKLSQGVAAWLRHAGAHAESLEGGFEAWEQGKGATGAPRPGATVNAAGPHAVGHPSTAEDRSDRMPLADSAVCRSGRCVPVRFPVRSGRGRDRFGATAFDIEDTFWSHRGETCTFDVMLEEFGLKSEALTRLATIVRGADTARLDIAPQAAGLLAASLGLSRMYRNDLEQLDAAMGLYDAFYRWSRDAAGETHNWPATPGPRA